MKRYQKIIKGGTVLFSLLMVLALTAGCAGSAGGGDGSGGGGSDLGGGYTPDPSPVFVSAFCPNHSASDAADDGGYGWVEIKITDIDALAAVDWKLKYSTYNYAETTLLDSTDLSWTLANDDVIRVHGSSYVASDTDKSDNNADIWDYTTSETFFISTSYAHIWLEDGDGTHLDTVAYSTSKNTNNYWLATDNEANLQKSVDLAIWGGSTITDAVTINGQYTKLIDDSSDGNSKDDWQDVELDDFQMTAESSSPTSIYENNATDVTFSVNVVLYGNASITGVNGDFSNLGEGSSVAMTDSDGDGVYSVTLTGVDLAAASYDITYTTNGLTLDGAAAAEETVDSTFEVEAASIDMTVESSSITTIPADTATDVTFDIKVALNGNVSITGVTGDFSNLGEGSSVALTDDDSDGVYTVTFSGVNLTAGSYESVISTTGASGASDESVTATLVVSDGGIAYLFTNSDMELDMILNSYGLYSDADISAEYTTVTGHDGTDSRVLHISGNHPSSNPYIFTTEANCNAPGAATKVTFWLKGTSPDKTISINMGGRKFNLGVVTGEKTVNDSASNSYTGRVECADWTKITLNIDDTDVDVASDTFGFKVGKLSDWDIYIDDIVFE